MIPSKAQLLFIVLFIFSSFYQLSIVESQTQEQQQPLQYSSSSFTQLNHQGSSEKSYTATATIYTNRKQWKKKNVKKRRSISMSKKWLAAHNKIRRAMGEPPLVWDKKLARYARRFAVKRVNDCRMIHSDGPYGENIWWGYRNVFSPEDVVDQWLKEQKDYNRSLNQCATNKVCGHYKQLVWKDSVCLGCALVGCKNGSAYAICSYNPPGNYKGEDPFVKHES